MSLDAHGNSRERAPVVSATLSKSYPQPVGQILELTIECRPGEIVAILGPSGGGKTTILNMLAGLVEPDPGSEIDFPRNAFSYAFQQAELAPWRDCEDNAYLEADILDIPRASVEPQVERLLKLMRLDSYRVLLPEQLSVGMRQRLQLARVAARPVRVFLLDEPLGAVDQPLRIKIAEELRSLFKESDSAAIWVTHDSREAVAVADRVLVLSSKPARIIAEHAVRRAADSDDTELQPNPVDVSASTLPILEVQATTLRGIMLSEYNKQQPHSETSALITKLPLTKKDAASNRYLKILLALIPLAILLVAWELLVRLQPSFDFFISMPSKWIPMVVSEFQSGNLATHIVVTLRETFLGLAIGLSGGVVVGYTSSRSWRTAAALRPYLVGLTAVPLFVLAPAFILWFGIGESMKVAIAALSCFPFVGYMVHDAAVEAKGRFYQYLDIAGGKRSELFLHLVLPSTLEAVLLSLRPAAVAALIGAFLGEFIAANVGLGYYIIFQASRYRIAEVFVGVLFLFLIAVIIEALARWLAEKRIRIISLMGI